MIDTYLQKAVDNTTTAGKIYTGLSNAGTAEGTNNWQITRTDAAGNVMYPINKHGEVSTEFIFNWNARDDYSYGYVNTSVPAVLAHSAEDMSSLDTKGGSATGTLTFSEKFFKFVSGKFVYFFPANPEDGKNAGGSVSYNSGIDSNILTVDFVAPDTDIDVKIEVVVEDKFGRQSTVLTSASYTLFDEV